MRFGNQFLSVHTSCSVDGQREACFASLPRNVEVGVVLLVASVVRSRKEDDACLETFGLVKIHQPDGGVGARFERHLFELVFRIVTQVLQFPEAFDPVPAGGLPPAKECQQTE